MLSCFYSHLLSTGRPISSLIMFSCLCRRELQSSKGSHGEYYKKKVVYKPLYYINFSWIFDGQNVFNKVCSSKLSYPMVWKTVKHKLEFYCVNTSYPMDNMLNRSAQTGPPNVRKRRPVFPPAGRSVVLCTPKMAPRTSFLSRQPDVIASFSFGACTVQTCFQQSPDILRKSVHYDGFSTLFANN